MDLTPATIQAVGMNKENCGMASGYLHEKTFC